MIENLWLRVADKELPPRSWLWADVVPPFQDGDIATKRHEEASMTIRRVMLTLVGLSFFSLLTLATPDENLVASNPTIDIPFANTEVNFVGFLFWGPILLIGITIYLQVHLGYFSAMEKANRNSLRETSKTPVIFNIEGRMAALISRILLYWMVPFVLCVFTWKALPRQEVSWLIALTGLMVMTTLFMLIRRCPPDERGRNRTLWVAILLTLIATVTEMPREWRWYPRGLDLYNVDLSAQDLSGMDLYLADLREANLSQTTLSRANLTEANLNGANAEGANLERAILRGAKISLEGMSMEDLFQREPTYSPERSPPVAELRGAILEGADLTEADLRGVILEGGDLTWANLKNADFIGADLRGATLERANLESADFTMSDLSKANLTRAGLKGAILAWADLREVNLLGIENWILIDNIKLANVFAVENPPEGFLEWAQENGAVSLESNEEWQAEKEGVGREETLP